jgi:hypothetical protein
MMASVVAYANGIKGIVDGSIDLENGTICFALVTASYTPDAASHDAWDDIVANEISTSGYDAYGGTLANVSVTIDGGTAIVVDADNYTFSSLGSTAIRYGVMLQKGADAGSSPVILYADLNQNSNDRDYYITFNDSGIIRFAL